MLFTLLVACERDGALTVPAAISVSTPDSFARFIDEQQSLPAGDYTIIATTTSADAGAAGSYTISVTFDDGSTEDITGTWIASAGQVSNPALHAAANLHDITLGVAGGIRIEMSSDLESFFYLIDRNNVAAASSADAFPWVTPSGTGINDVAIDLPANISDSVHYARAYYDALDASDSRDSLNKWRLANCFSNDQASDYDADAHVVFRDVSDLGYGRNMYWKFGCDGNGNAGAEAGAIAVFVENFNVRVLPGFPYSTLNLQAVVKDDRQHHFGTNAIEFNSWHDGSSGVSAGNPYGRQFT